MNYAVIENGMVSNLIWLHPMNASEFSEAVSIGDIPVQIGDTYEDGVFYRDGEKVLAAEEVAQAEMSDMREALAELGVTLDE